MAQVIHARFRRGQADVWLTISGWIWVAYTAGLVVVFVTITA
jgi:hypothetical protein